MPQKKSKHTRVATENEIILWQSVTSDVDPLSPKEESLPVVETNNDVPRPRPPSKMPRRRAETPLLPSFSLKPPSYSGAAEKLPHTLQTDKAFLKRLRNGELSPEASLDLHGLTLEKAHEALVRFLSLHIDRGARILLVITGKGRGGDGIIRKSFPLWCEHPAFRPFVLFVNEAAPRHGGSGAFYVLLRRKRG